METVKIDWYNDEKGSNKEIQRRGKRNEGFCLSRIEGDHNQAIREKAFHDAWQEENDLDKRFAIGYGFGILQDLFMIPAPGRYASMFSKRAVVVIKRRERFIVSTVIQWLGTNVGFSFLQTVLDKAGYDIVKRK